MRARNRDEPCRETNTDRAPCALPMRYRTQLVWFRYNGQYEFRSRQCAGDHAGFPRELVSARYSAGAGSFGTSKHVHGFPRRFATGTFPDHRDAHIDHIVGVASVCSKKPSRESRIHATETDKQRPKSQRRKRDGKKYQNGS